MNLFQLRTFYLLRKFLSIALIFIDYVNLYRLRESLNLYQSRESLSIFKSLSIAWIFINFVDSIICVCVIDCVIVTAILSLMNDCARPSQKDNVLYIYKTYPFWFGPMHANNQPNNQPTLHVEITISLYGSSLWWNRARKVRAGFNSTAWQIIMLRLVLVTIVVIVCYFKSWTRGNSQCLACFRQQYT